MSNFQLLLPKIFLQYLTDVTQRHSILAKTGVVLRYLAYLVLLLPFGLSAETPAAKQGVWDGKTHVVYHVSDQGSVKFALNNMRNHLKGGGGADKLDLVLVVHGPAGKAFTQQADDKVKNWVASLQKQGATFNMCGNTMQALDLELSDLLPGFTRHDEGGVVRIAELQSKGYLYIRP